MVIIGNGGHALEVLSIVMDQYEEIFLFDDFSRNSHNDLLRQFVLLETEEQLRIQFEKAPAFVLGVGNPKLRAQLASRGRNLGGKLTSAIAESATISKLNVDLGDGINVMHGAFISANVTIGEGALVNASAHLHHDCTVGRYSEVSPGAKILGGAEVGDFCQIGTNTVVLPGIQIGKNTVVGAGAVVTKNIGENSLAVGMPARIIKKLG